jgi:hypothetical protein
MIEMTKRVELDQDQIDIIIQTLVDRKNDLDIVIKEEGLEAAIIRDMLIERREIDNIIRELQFYSVVE